MSRDADVGPILSKRLTYLFKRALIDLENIHLEYLEPFGISGRELSVMLLLHGREPESQQQTAERLHVDRTTMVAVLDGLEAKGLVARQADPQDRRRNVVALTNTGQRMLDKAVKASDKAERRFLGALDDDERTELRALLARLATDEREDG